MKIGSVVFAAIAVAATPASAGGLLGRMLFGSLDDTQAECPAQNPGNFSNTWRCIRARVAQGQGSVAAAVALYLGSMDFGHLAEATRQDRRRDLERFRVNFADQPFAGLERTHVERMLAAKASTPHAARNFLKALGGLIAVAITAGLRTDDPTVGVRVKLRASIGIKTWPEDAIAQFEAIHPIGSKARLAFGLLLYTAQRLGDVIRMGRQHVKDGFIRVAQQKTGAVLEIPIIPELREILAAHPADHLTFLTTRAGEPFAGPAFTNWFRDRCAEAGLPKGLVAHGHGTPVVTQAT
jgi:integrase